MGIKRPDCFYSDQVFTFCIQLSIMASIAQEESRKISERVKWGIRRKMEDGWVYGYCEMLGFRTKNGKLEIVPEEGITFEVPTANKIIVKGIDKHLVGQVAASIRAIKPPEPYNQKGIRYENEHVIKKEGKKGK